MVAAVTTRRGGFAEMAYVGATPWHGQGQRLTRGAPIEEWVREAGMDWRVSRSRVRYATAAGLAEFPGQVALFRSDTHAPLGVVSDAYKPVQPRETLEFFRDLVSGEGYELETAGTLFGGRKFWALAAMGEDAVVVGDDAVRGFLLLSTSCDGSAVTSARVTSVRVVCNNTLTAALSGRARHAVSVGHRSRFDAEAVKRDLGLARGTFREFIAGCRRLAARRVHDVAAREWVGELLAEAGVAKDPALAQETKQFRSVMELFRGAGRGASMPGAAGTAWGLVNAVTEFVDHRAQARSAENRLDSAWFGRGAGLKDLALARAAELA